ncbi:hypothetical protein ALC53_01985, partial [Atta colombica]
YCIFLLATIFINMRKLNTSFLTLEFQLEIIDMTLHSTSIVHGTAPNIVGQANANIVLHLMILKYISLSNHAKIIEQTPYDYY